MQQSFFILFYFILFFFTKKLDWKPNITTQYTYQKVEVEVEAVRNRTDTEEGN